MSLLYSIVLPLQNHDNIILVITFAINSDTSATVHISSVTHTVYIASCTYKLYVQNVSLITLQWDSVLYSMVHRLEHCWRDLLILPG